MIKELNEVLVQSLYRHNKAMLRPLLLIYFAIPAVFCAVAKKDRVIEQKPLSDEQPGSPEYDHEAFLGKEEAHEFDDLSPEESKRRLGMIVDKLDVDKDGKITEDELKKWILFAQTRYIIEDTKQQFDPLDANNNGYVEWEEYKKTTYGHILDEELQSEDGSISSYKKMIDKDHRRWKRSDQNNDNVQTIEEFKAFLHPEEHSHMRDVVLDETIEDMDKNGDGLIDLEEYIGDMYTEQDEEEPEWVQTEREQFIKYRDEDKDGALNREEISKWILPDDYDHIEAEAKHLIYESDDDKDDVLTKEEILNHHSLFVKSQVTNWGDDLKRHDEF